MLAATNRNLQAAVTEGTFREDLFYRLNVVPIQVPPLRERMDDLPVLVEYLVTRYAEKVGRRIGRVERRTLERLQTYGWPGNIRELQNVIERAVILCEGDRLSIDEAWLKPDARARSPRSSPPKGSLGRSDQAHDREVQSGLAIRSTAWCLRSGSTPPATPRLQDVRPGSHANAVSRR